MACKCCVTWNADVRAGTVDAQGQTTGMLDISNNTISISVDTTQDILNEYKSDDNCNLTDDMLYLYGPSKSVMQLEAYPFDTDNCYLGFTCPVSVSVSIPWKYVFDCRLCVPCIDARTGQPTGAHRRGWWRAIPMKKKQVVVTGDTGSLFDFAGCAMPVAKYTLQAGPNPVITPQPSMQYTQAIYHGIPIPFDTMNPNPFRLSIVPGQSCDWVASFTNVDAYLDSFSFNFKPPAPPTCQYSFSVMLPLCVTC